MSARAAAAAARAGGGLNGLASAPPPRVAPPSVARRPLHMAQRGAAAAFKNVHCGHATSPPAAATPPPDKPPTTTTPPMASSAFCRNLGSKYGTRSFFLYLILISFE